MLLQPTFHLLKKFIGFFRLFIFLLIYCSDGGLMANNPTIELITEFFRYKSIMEVQGKVKFFNTF